MSPCSSLDKATRRCDLSQQGDVLCMKVTAESREVSRAAIWLEAPGWARAPQQPQYKRRHKEGITEAGGDHRDIAGDSLSQQKAELQQAVW